MSKKSRFLRLILLIITIIVSLFVVVIGWINVAFPSEILEYFRMDLVKTILVLIGIFYVCQKFLSYFSTNKQDKYILEILGDLYKSLDKISLKLYSNRLSRKELSSEESESKYGIEKIFDEIYILEHSCYTLKDFIVEYKYSTKINFMIESLSELSHDIREFLRFTYDKVKIDDEMHISSLLEKMERWEYKIKEIKHTIRRLMHEINLD